MPNVEHEVSFNILHEPWAEYITEDGESVRVRATVDRVFRMSDGTLKVVSNTRTTVLQDERNKD